MGLLIGKGIVYEDGAYKKVGAKKAESKKPEAPAQKPAKPAKKGSQKPVKAAKAPKGTDGKGEGEKPAETQK